MLYVRALDRKVLRQRPPGPNTERKHIKLVGEVVEETGNQQQEEAPGQDVECPKGQFSGPDIRPASVPDKESRRVQ